MAWTFTCKKDIPHLISFLTKNEWRCIAFTSRIKENSGCLLARSFSGWNSFVTLVNVNEKNRNKESGICEAIMLTSSGVAIPVLNKDIPFSLEENHKLRVFIKNYRQRLHSVLGDLNSVNKIEKLFLIEHHRRIDYHTMSCDLIKMNLTNINTYSVDGLLIRRADPEDTFKLYDLQKSYEIEEVLLDPYQFNEKNCRNLLKKSLQQQVIFMAEFKGIPVAKAGTNARGYKTDQIGGVFTRVDLRGLGIGTLIMKELLKSLGKYNKTACLFVKKNNPAGLVLYKKLGFHIQGSFRITYYIHT